MTQPITIKILAAILDCLTDPVLVADTNHITFYLNKAAAEHYDDGYKLLGKSLLDCHNPESRQVMKDILAQMEAGLDEKLITDNDKHRIYMRSVRDESGKLLGYFERYEPPVSSIPEQ